jgi:SAM-dependent methyltransferase
VDPLTRARSIGSIEEARALYRDWAEHYDRDVFDTMRVRGSRRIAELLALHVPDRSTPILDLGCGTGAVGGDLAGLGFSDVAGLDISPEMLAVAQRRRVYRWLSVADLNEPLVVDDRFGASVSAGTFTHGHVGASAIDQVLRLHEPGATLAWVVARDMWSEFEALLRATGASIVEANLEPIRDDAEDLARFIVARLPA